MGTNDLQQGDQVIVTREHFPQLLVSLHGLGYQVVGPTVRENAIVYDTLNSVEDLPMGYTDEQDGGYYRLKKRGDSALFGYTVGPHSWKKFLHPPVLGYGRLNAPKGRFSSSRRVSSLRNSPFLGCVPVSFMPSLFKIKSFCILPIAILHIKRSASRFALSRSIVDRQVERASAPRCKPAQR